MVEDKTLYTVLPYKRLNNNHLNIRSGINIRFNHLGNYKCCL